MKLDTKAMRYLTSEDWRVLTAVEMGSKNHEVVPTPLIEKVSRLRGGSSGVRRSISTLAKAGLVARVREAKYDGYRLTYGGLDYLALHTHAARDDVYSVGNRIGVGKESDIVVVADASGAQRVLKIHRLGRISFRSVKTNRDYLRGNRAAAGSWMYLSRLAATKEFAFMKALRDEDFPVPEPLAHSRHTIVMALIDAFPLRQISSVPDPAGLYAELIGLVLRLARHGLIHGDFNEFNILIKEEKIEEEAGEEEGKARDTEDKGAGENKREAHNQQDGDDKVAEDTENLTLTPVVIDFPQMVSMDHPNAESYFDRDVGCVKRFFERRFRFVSTQPGPFFRDAKKTVGAGGARRLDAVLEASGFTKKMAKDLEAALREKEAAPEDDDADAETSDDESDGESEEEEEESEQGDAIDQGSSFPEPLLGRDHVPDDIQNDADLQTRNMQHLDIGKT